MHLAKDTSFLGEAPESQLLLFFFEVPREVDQGILAFKVRQQNVPSAVPVFFVRQLFRINGIKLEVLHVIASPLRDGALYLDLVLFVRLIFIDVKDSDVASAHPPRFQRIIG